MKDNIFKSDRHQSGRDENYHDDAFQNMDTNSSNGTDSWNSDTNRNKDYSSKSCSSNMNSEYKSTMNDMNNRIDNSTEGCGCTGKTENTGNYFKDMSYGDDILGIEDDQFMDEANDLDIVIMEFETFGDDNIDNNWNNESNIDNLNNNLNNNQATGYSDNTSKSYKSNSCSANKDRGTEMKNNNLNDNSTVGFRNNNDKSYKSNSCSANKEMNNDRISSTPNQVNETFAQNNNRTSSDLADLEQGSEFITPPEDSCGCSAKK